MGEIVLDAQQVSVGKALLNKVLPDLSSTTLEGGEKALNINFRIGGE
jgi:hypothetical protein